MKSGGDVDSNGANIGDIKRISKANDTRIKDGNYEVSQNGTVEMTYVDGSGKQLVDEHGNPVKATIPVSLVKTCPTLLTKVKRLSLALAQS